MNSHDIALKLFGAEYTNVTDRQQQSMRNVAICLKWAHLNFERHPETPLLTWVQSGMPFVQEDGVRRWLVLPVRAWCEALIRRWDECLTQEEREAIYAPAREVFPRHDDARQVEKHLDESRQVEKHLDEWYAERDRLLAEGVEV